jgi:hypothetical protein
VVRRVACRWGVEGTQASGLGKRMTLTFWCFGRGRVCFGGRAGGRVAVEIAWRRCTTRAAVVIGRLVCELPEGVGAWRGRRCMWKWRCYMSEEGTLDSWNRITQLSSVDSHLADGRCKMEVEVLLIGPSTTSPASRELGPLSR